MPGKSRQSRPGRRGCWEPQADGGSGPEHRRHCGMLCWVTQRSQRCRRQRAPNATVACWRGSANSGAAPLGLAPRLSGRRRARATRRAAWCRPPTHGIDAGRQKGGQRPRSVRERGRRTGLLPSMVIAAVPATDLHHGRADEANEVADGRQRRPQHAAPRPRRDMPRSSGELQAHPTSLSGVPRGGEGRGQRGGLAGWGQPSHRSVVFQASPLAGESSLPGARPRLGGCPSGVTRQSRSPPDPGSNCSVRPCSVTVRTTCSDAPPGSRASILPRIQRIARRSGGWASVVTRCGVRSATSTRRRRTRRAACVSRCALRAPPIREQRGGAALPGADRLVAALEAALIAETPAHGEPHDGGRVLEIGARGAGPLVEPPPTGPAVEAPGAERGAPLPLRRGRGCPVWTSQQRPRTIPWMR